MRHTWAQKLQLCFTSGLALLVAACAASVLITLVKGLESSLGLLGTCPRFWAGALVLEAGPILGLFRTAFKVAFGGEEMSAFGAPMTPGGLGSDVVGMSPATAIDSGT